MTARTTRSTEAPIEDLLTPAEAARMLGMSEKTLRNWRSAGVGPAWARVGSRSVRYHPEAVRAFIAEAA